MIYSWGRCFCQVSAVRWKHMIIRAVWSNPSWCAFYVQIVRSFYFFKSVCLWESRCLYKSCTCINCAHIPCKHVHTCQRVGCVHSFTKRDQALAQELLLNCLLSGFFKLLLLQRFSLQRRNNISSDMMNWNINLWFYCISFKCKQDGISECCTAHCVLYIFQADIVWQGQLNEAWAKCSTARKNEERMSAF